MGRTAARGTTPFDKSFGLGYQVGHGDYSPYKRVNSLRDYFFAQEFHIDSQRGELVTKAYQKYKAAPQVIKVARALENVLTNVNIKIYPGELIVGEIAAPYKYAPVYPEFSYDWVVDEMRNAHFDKRVHDMYYMDRETEEKLFSLEGFWQGKTVKDAIDSMLSPDEKKGSNLGKGLFLLNLYHYAGVGHFVADYEKLLTVGYGGLKREVEGKMADLDTTKAEDIEKRSFYEALLISLNASSTFIKRYATLARQMAEVEVDEIRKQELLQIGENCDQIAEGVPRDIWEAIQLFHFATTIILIESNGHSVSYGRMDQYLYPFYKKDIDSGRFTKEQIQELIELLYIKCATNCKLRDAMTIIANAGRGWGGESLTVGGVDKDGRDATNDLTYMMLDASAHTRIIPWLCVRWHANTPEELKIKTVEIIRAGFGHPKIFNDEIAIPAALAKGRSLQEARNYAVVGCVEIDTPGYEYGWHDAAYFSLAKVLELAINDGRCIACAEYCPRWSICGSLGLKLGPSTGSLSNFTSFDQVLESYEKQLKYWIDLMVSGIEVMDICHQKLKPLPYLSLIMNDCIDKGIDVSAGGARFNHTGPQAAGIGNVADGLSIIKQLIFEEKKVKGEEILQALQDNWEGHDALYALVNSDKMHHYGNDDDYADDMAKFAFDTYCAYVETKTNSRGGTYTPGVYTVSANVAFGLLQWASVDGRKAGEAISDNMGPTAIANSVTKLDHSRATNGTLLNWKFTPEAVSGLTGRDNLINLIEVYFLQGGMHSQFNIISSAMMRDALENPHLYKDMLVRVAGYSALFVELSYPLQIDLINRTELSFE